MRGRSLKMSNPRRIVVMATGTKKGGGSGLQWLYEATRTGVITNTEISAVVCDNEIGGVRTIAERFDIPFVYLPHDEESAESYQEIVKLYDPRIVCLSGYLRRVQGLDPRMVINVHPGDTVKFGGHGMYGHRVHEAVVEAFERGEVSQTYMTMHFATGPYDKGPIFFKFPIALRKGESPEELGRRVNEVEHSWQAPVTELVLNRRIRLMGSGTKTDPWQVHTALSVIEMMPVAFRL